MTKPKTKTIQPVPDDNKSHKGPGSAPSVPLDTTKGHRDDEKHNIREQAAQCGYCLNGMIITTKALLTRNPNPSEHEVLEALRYHEKPKYVISHGKLVDQQKMDEIIRENS